MPGNNQDKPQAISIYVHLPWCVRKCPYCDFNSHPAEHGFDEPEYTSALLREIAGYRDLLKECRIDSVFFGGGTPSLFSAGAIQSVLSQLASCSSLNPDIEITLEANPGTAEAGRFRDYVNAGINRLSLGIQSFNDAALQALGRIHNADEARAAIDMVQQSQVSRFNLDLMHGLPGQTAELALQDLETAISFDPDHISWYQLTLEPNTLFYRHPPDLPDENTLADIQQTGASLLTGSGFERYEVSAWARANRQCTHNLNYWCFGNYLGLGAGAHGKLPGPDSRSYYRTSNSRHPADYMQTAGTPACTKRELIQEPRKIVFEFMLNRLRLERAIALSEFSNATGLAAGVLTDAATTAIRQGLLLLHDDVLECTATGRRFLDNTVATFLD